MGVHTRELENCTCVETENQLYNCIGYSTWQTTVATVNCSKYIARLMNTFYAKEAGNGDSQANVCSANRAMRLVGGSTVSEGRLEICYNGQWGTICNQGWTDSRASQVCSTLRLPTYSELLGHSI